MTRITTPFGRHSTATEVVEGIDLSNKRAIVTGAASGIGVETARALAHAGAEVTLAVRNTDAGAQTATDIIATTGNQNIHVAQLDLSDQPSISKFVAAWDSPLHILINNAGVMALPERHNPETANRRHERCCPLRSQPRQRRSALGGIVAPACLTRCF
jgi:NAD(P)-dependent dehydrogenase (short-subunit alcohol dehydrogenase family)